MLTDVTMATAQREKKENGRAMHHGCWNTRQNENGVALLQRRAAYIPFLSLSFSLLPTDATSRDRRRDISYSLSFILHPSLVITEFLIPDQ